jgi:hypothetical protein
VINIPLANAVNTTETSAEDKLPSFLSEVIGLDLAKYDIVNEGYGVSFPSEFGGLVKEESIIFTLEFEDSRIAVSGVFDNGFPSWINFYPLSGSILYANLPSTDSLEESKSILQRYRSFAQTYGINTAYIDSALTLLSDVPDSPPALASSGNFNNISDFTPANLTVGNMKLVVSQKGVGCSYVTEGVDVPNKSFGLSFGSNTFVFSDTWNLYSIGSLSVISKDEATDIAWFAAKNYNLTFTETVGNTTTVLEPDWSEMRSAIGLVMIPGQIYNSSLNNVLNFVSLGSITRDPLMLYPLWQAIFYFSQPIGDIDGIQVGVWGDTKEIAYCSTYGFLGGASPFSTATAQPAFSSSPSDFPHTSSTPSVTPSNGLSFTPLPSESPCVSPTLVSASLEPTSNPSQALGDFSFFVVGMAVVVVGVGVLVFVLRRKPQRHV